MPDRPKITVTIDGEAKEVELPDGVLLETEVRENYVPTSVVDTRLKEAEKKLKGSLSRDLMESEDFIGRLVELKRDDLLERLDVKPAKGEPDEQAVQKLTQRILEKEVNPLKEQLAEKDKEVERWRGRARDADIAEALNEVGVADDYRELIQLWAEKQLAYDPDHGWVVMDGDGKPDFVIGDDRKPAPKRIKHLLDEVKASGKKAGWFKGTVKDGVGYKGHDGRPASKKPQDMSEAEKMAYIREHGQAAYLKLLAENRKKVAA